MTPISALDILRHPQSGDNSDINEAIQCAISALEKQIPKKPIERFINAYSDEMAISCPCCKQPIVNVWNKRDYKPLYCHYCGQALDWSNTV